MDARREQDILAALGTTVHLDPAAVSAGLDRWLAERFPGARTTGFAVPGGSGASSELFFAVVQGAPWATGAGDAEVVLRLAPAHAVYPVVDLGIQADCMRAAARGGAVPVPRVHAVETDPRWLGKPFLLMQRLHGRGAPDWPSYVLEGWIRELPEDAQRKLWLRAIDAIALLHSTDVSNIPQARLAAPGATPLDRMLGYWERFLAFVHEGGDYPVLQDAVASLRRDRPLLPEREGLVWGDASLRNMLFEDARPVALMDFEFAHVGVCDFDIAFFAIMDHIMAEGFAGGAPRLPGFPGVAETFDYYAAVNGRNVGSRDYLMRTALTYSAMATTRVYQRLASQGRVAPEDVARNPPLALLGRLMDGSWTPR